MTNIEIVNVEAQVPVRPHSFEVAGDGVAAWELSAGEYEDVYMVEVFIGTEERADQRARDLTAQRAALSAYSRWEVEVRASRIVRVVIDAEVDR